MLSSLRIVSWYKASGIHGLLESSGSDDRRELIQEKDTQPSENTSKVHNEVAPIEVEPKNVKFSIRRFTRIPQAPDRYGFYVDVKEYELGDLNEPPNYKAALSYPEFDKWLEAMNTEMQSMKDNQVWVLVDLPPNGRNVRSKWLFWKKTDMDGKMNVKTAFLDGHLSEDMYMAKPEGFVDPKHPNKNQRKILVLLKILDEPCGISQVVGNVAFLILYVDDILLMGNNVTMLQEVKSWLFKVLFLEKTLKKFRMENSKKGYTPMIENSNYRKSQGAQTPNEVQRMRRVPYALAIGSIMNTKDMVLVYGGKPEAELRVSCYADASFQTDKEAEYIAAAEALMEAFWMRKFIDGLGDVVPSNKRPMEMLCDNKPAITIANDPGILKGARHFQRKYHYIRKVIQEREIVLKKVHTDDNVANPFTKPML
ncbi:hypothetical protein Tco_1575197 [Tanacetum coccineum]